MGYLQSLWKYLKTEKGRHDFTDYVRAIVIMAAVMAVLRIAVELIPGWLSAVISAFSI